MKKHIVTCVKCGRQFDANEGGAYYPESRRYVCKRCVDKQKSEQADREKARKAEERKAEADERERVTGMRQSKAARYSSQRSKTSPGAIKRASAGETPQRTAIR